MIHKILFGKHRFGYIGLDEGIILKWIQEGKFQCRGFVKVAGQRVSP
jgi:hypothetical protein